MRGLAALLTPALVRWRWVVVAVWTLLIGFAALLMPGLDRLAKDDDGAFHSPSAHAHAVLREKLGQSVLTELVVIYEGVPPERYRRQLDAALKADADVTGVKAVPLPAGKGIALDRVSLTHGLDDQHAVEVAKRLRALVAANPPPAGVTPHLFGRPVLILELGEMNRKEVARVERVSLGLSFIVLVVVFGSLASALLPVAMGLAGITLTLGVLVGLGGAIPVSGMTRLVTSIIAIAVGIDYALFVVSRYREERAAGRDVEASVELALTHAGAAVALSALIMGVSILALVVPDFTGTRAIAGAIAVVLAVSLLTTFTLLPALLAIADRWVASERARSRELRRRTGAWARLATWVLSHHRLVLAATALVLGLLVGQLSNLRLWEPGPTLLPTSLSSRQGYDALSRAGLAGELDSMFLVISQPPGKRILAPGTLATMAQAKGMLLFDHRIARVDSLLDAVPKGQDPARFFAQLDGPLGRLFLLPRLHGVLASDAGGTYTVMRIMPREGLASPALRELVVDTQANVMGRINREPGVRLDLGGYAARRVDFTNALYDPLPLMVLLVVVVVYVLLLVYFRSLVLPLKAVAMNALPVLGACGVLVLVFQDGIGASLLGIDPPGAVMAMTPMVIFGLVFGLGMDYEVLILSRIQEAHLNGADDDTAIHAGMSATGGIVTGAAAIMLSVFAPNMASAMVNAKELGLGLSTAVLLDATVIRLLLVPAFMRAMGRWNWYFPGRG